MAYANASVEYHDVALRLAENLADEIIEQIRASGKTPVITGRLLEGYRVGYDAASDSYIVYSDVPYWVYVEFGTHRSKAEPHVRPAIEAVYARHGVDR